MRNKKHRIRQAALALGVVGALGACSHEVESPGVSVDRLEPDLICSEQFPPGGRELTLYGSGFAPLPEKTLEEPARLELPSVVLDRASALDGSEADAASITFSGEAGQTNADHLGWQSEEQMSLSIDASIGLEPGIYGLTLTNPDRKTSATKDVALAVVPPPRVDRVLPPTLCNGFQDQRLTLEGENFIEIGGTGPSVELVNGETYSYEADSFDDCTELVGLSQTVRICGVISVVIPGNQVPQNDYDVFVTNPDPAGCTSSEPATVKVLEDGPVLFFADPTVVYNGINTKVILFMTAVAEPFTVILVPAGQIAPETELQASLVPGSTNRMQATVPAGQAPGEYDIIVNDATGCQTVLARGLTVTDNLSLPVDRVVPPFGHTEVATAVTVFGDGSGAFEPTPRGFLNPVNAGAQDVAIQLESVTLVNPDELTAVVPEDTPVGSYDLIVINPSGAVGLLPDAFHSVADPPPVIADVVPQSIVDQGDQPISISGTGFSSASASVLCQDANGNLVEPASTVSSEVESCDADGCSLAATIDGSGLGVGAVCVVRVENADGSYGDFSAIGVTNSSFNLSTPRAGRPLIQARHSLVAAAVKATSASRFLYAIGGDGGSALDSIEYAPVNVFGTMSDFVEARQRLGVPRARLGGTPVGRYLYAVGGSDGSSALATAERALVLSPEESPGISDIDLCLSGLRTPCYGDAALGSGLPAGEYSYRVSALIDPADPQNLGGETLASDPQILKLPDVDGRGILVELSWSAPADALGDELSGIAGFRIYRTPVDGVPGRDEVLLAELDDPELREFVDDGTLTPGSETPLPQGSTSAWQALPDLDVARDGLGVAAGRDPEDADTWYLYALLGVGLASYEHLTIHVLPNGRQTVEDAWVVGAEEAATARSEFGTWVVDRVVSDLVADTQTFIFLGGGLAGADADGAVEAAEILAGGELGSFADDPGAQDAVGDFSSTRVGYGTAAAAGRLFVFGGMASQTRDNATAAELVSPAPSLANNSWNNEGLSMTSARYLPGSTIQSAFIFLVGGQVDGSGDATNSTELVIW